MCRDSSNFDHLFQENFDKESKNFDTKKTIGE